MKRLVYISCIVVALIGTVPIILRLAIHNSAQTAARHFAKPALAAQTTQERSRIIAKRIFKAYTDTRNSSYEPLLFKLRPYLTNEILPDFYRIEAGAIEALYIEGKCDSAARATVYVLSAIGIEARQVNLIGRNGAAHSLVRVYEPDGTSFLIDPIYGLAPKQDGVLLGRSEILDLQQEGLQPEEIWYPLTAKARYSANYDQFADSWLIPQGDEATFTVDIDPGASDHIRLGNKDSDSRDVAEAGAEYGLSVYWHYLGHRYDRGWTRRLRALEPVRITITTVKPVKSGNITTDQAPLERGTHHLVYMLDAGETLSFIDGDARRDWLSFRSYQAIDMILIEKL